MMRELVPVDLSWIEARPDAVRVSIALAAAPARVFEALADAPGWTRWFPLMHRAASIGGGDGDGGGVGAEREVAVRGFGRLRERFLAWEPGARYAFTMIGVTSPLIAQMGEDYRITPTGDGARLDWTMAALPRGPGRLLAPGLRVMMRRIFARAGRNLDALLRG
jgi:hypothetical protein